MRAYGPFAVILVALLLGSLVAACQRPSGPTTNHVYLITTGDMRVDWSVQASAESSADELVYRVPRGSRVGSNPPPTTITVEQTGITTLTLEQWERETSSGLTARSWLRKQALFVISGPAGAVIKMPFSDATDPRDVRGTIDYDADGTVDAELSPTATGAAKNLDAGVMGAAVEAQIEEDGDGRAIISFVPTAKSALVAGIYFSIYPSHPQLQFYSEPFVVDEGSFILYGAYGELAQRQPTQQVGVLGGVDDVQLEADIDGEPHDVRTNTPGQNAVVSFEGQREQQVEVSLGPMIGGIQSHYQATLVLTGPDGMVLHEVAPHIATAASIDPWSFVVDLPADGVYTIVIDPRLANVISTTVTLIPAPQSSIEARPRLG